MATYRLLALDMDGTLLNTQKLVSPRTREALLALSEQGVAIAFATGRNVLEMSFYSDDLSFIRYGVLSTGSIIYDFAHGVALHQTPLGAAATKAAVMATFDEKGLPFISCVDGTRGRQRDIDRLEEYGMGAYRAGYELICERVDDPLAWIDAHPDAATKLDLYLHDAGSMRRTEAAIAASGVPIEVAECDSHALECTAAGVTKGVGLRMLAQRLGISMDEVVAVGDDGNDLSMLRVVGMPVAMANACPEALAIARYVTADNDHDGIAEAIEELFS